MVATLLLLLCLGVGNVWGETATLTISEYASANSWSNSSKYSTAVVSPITFTGSGGTNSTKYFSSDDTWRFYSSDSPVGRITITTTSAYKITSISSSPSKTWTKTSDTEWYHQVSSNTSFTSITVTYSAAAPATPHTVRFYTASGIYSDIEEASAGAGVTPPVMSTPCDGWAFQGWSKSQSTSSTSTTVLTTETLTAGKYYPTANTTLYPVYTKAGTIEQEVSDEITQSTTGLCTGGKGCSSGYTSWSNKSDESDAVYAGQSNAGVAFLQLRNSSPSGIISTSSGGVLKKVIVAWKTSGTPSNTTGRYVTIFGKTSAYSGCANLYDNSKKGTSLGNITYGTSTELDNLNEDNDYGYVGILASAAVYINTITITWLVEEDVTYYYSYPSCCTPLGSINGSINLSQTEAIRNGLSFSYYISISKITSFTIW